MDPHRLSQELIDLVDVELGYDKARPLRDLAVAGDHTHVIDDAVALLRRNRIPLPREATSALAGEPDEDDRPFPDP